MVLRERGYHGASPILVSHLAWPPFWLQQDLVADLPYLRVRLQSSDLQRSDRAAQGLVQGFSRRARSLAGSPGGLLYMGLHLPGGNFLPCLSSLFGRVALPTLPCR